MVSLSIIIVNYNGWEYLRKCLESIRAQTIFNKIETIVVDNGSTDGSYEKIKKEFPEVNLIRSEKNLGFGGGNNLGIEVAKGSLIGFVNNDTVLDNRWAETMVSAAETAPEEFGMFTSKILLMDSSNLIDNTGLLLYPDGIARGRGRLEKDEGQYNRLEEVFLPSGCACVFKREVLEEVGPFDEDFFLYLEDVDLGLRARLAGWRCLYVPDAMLYHHYSATASAYSPLKAYYVERNRIFILTKYYPFKWIFNSFFYSFKRYLYHFLGIFTNKGAGAKMASSAGILRSVWILLRAYFSGLMWVPRNLKKRWKFRGHIKVDKNSWTRWFRKYKISAKEVAWKE